MSRTIKYLLIALLVLALGAGVYFFLLSEEDPDMTVPAIELTESDTTAVSDAADTTSTTMDLSDLASCGDEEE